jgi:type I restriction enzyme S subunit
MSAVDGWKSKPLLEVLALTLDFRGRTPKKLGMEWGGGDIPALSANNVEMGRINFSKECYFGSGALYQKWMTRGDARIGDIVLTTEAPLGNVAQIPDERRYILSQRAIILRANNAELCNDYLKHYLTSEFFQNLMRQHSSGTTATGIQRAKLETLPVKFPISKTEQTKIAEILSTMDQAIEQTEALIAKQQRIKTGLMQDLLTRGIDEHGNLRSEQTHQFKDSPLGRIPVEWEVSDLEAITEFVTSGSRGWAKYYSTDGAIFLRIGNLTRNHINLRLDDIALVNPPKSSEGKRTTVSAGDLLISITADLGVIGVIPERFGEAYVNQHIALVRLLHTRVNQRFIGWFLSSRRGQTQFEKLNESGAKAGLNLPTVRRLLVPIMGLSEQTRIVEILDSNTQKTNDYHLRFHKLRSLKTALMQDLLTGKKRVTPLLEPEATH